MDSFYGLDAVLKLLFILSFIIIPAVVFGLGVLVGWLVL